MSEYETKGHEFIARVDALMHEVFDVETESPMVVIGLQYGATDEDTPVILSSNLPVCLVGSAIHDMHEAAVRQHEAYHAEGGESPFMDTPSEDVPEEVREFAARLADQFGVDPSQVVFRSSVDTDDLNDDGIAQLIGLPFEMDSDEPGEKFVFTGKDDIADPDLDRAVGEGMPEPTVEDEQPGKDG